ncbi:substrate-binding domain-containing protein [Phyllobacterium sp. 628]|uniref:ABC transporter substrate-binding protein n=1 Tax=Phyllobacterium sp. 628 TaxID=2718938 RepID=UPI001662389D|nr:substrate-binding domain-containing protein [Phyllobacterium sp. 628]QND50782.1 substrate-binding domain-containing protein [Phyllobacterium sp. 628]
MRLKGLLAATASIALCILINQSTASADDLVDTAKAKVAAASQKADHWDGPTTGPKASADKTIVYVAGDMRNGGILGVSDGIKEASAVMGWNFRAIDGQGTVSGQSAALNQAIALKPDAIILGGSDAVEQKTGLEAAAAQGIVIAGWHSGPNPGPMPDAHLFVNVTTNAMNVAEIAAMKVIADSDGKAGVVIFADSAYAIAIAKGRAMEEVIKKCAGCKVLSFEDTPLADTANRIPQLTTTLLQRYGAKWTHSLAINDLYYDFMGPSLAAAGLKGNEAPFNISAGDGSESAYQRIRSGQYQAATVPEPLAMQGWQVVDELNRAFSKQAWSGYVPGIHIVTADNIAFDGGDKNVFDPDNGYRDQYKKIWGK